MTEASIIVAFLTGQSDPGNTALSEVQRGFLKRSAVSPEQRCKLNFPYTRALMNGRKIPLWRASLNNIRQYLLSRDSAFSDRRRQSVNSLYLGHDQVIFLAGSCGLEILNNLGLSKDLLARTHIFAYGPVSRSLPTCATLCMVQGRRDFISKWWHRHPTHVVNCGHMNYLQSSETSVLFDEFYRSIINRIHANA